MKKKSYKLTSWIQGDIHYFKFEYFQMFDRLDLVVTRNVYKSRMIQ